MTQNPALATGNSGLTPDKKRELLQQKLREKIGEFQSLYSLSAGQQALWFLHRLAPHSPAYHIMCAARIDADLDIARLRRAFEALAHRHPSLRTTYKSVHGKPFQLVHDRLAIDLEVRDASTWSQEELNRIISQRADAPIDIERGIMRVCLFTQARDRHVLLLVLHHIAIDFWSLDLIIRELCVLYAIDPSKARMVLPPVTGSYADFVRRQKAIMDGPEGERLWRYWREKLAGELPVLNLCPDRPRPQVQTYDGASHRIELDDEIVNKLRQFANARGATIFTAVLGVFTVLLHRYTHQDDIIVATPAIGRNQPELEGVVGYFSNPVALRSRFSSGQRFAEYLEELRQTVLEAIEHQDYPFPTLVKRLEVKRDPSRSPVFQALFMWDKGTWYDNRPLPGGLKLEPFAFGQRGAPFDISLTVVEKGTTLTAIFSYNTDLFEEATISRLADHFSILLQGIIENPTQEIAKLPLLTEAERQQVLVEWNNTAADYPRSLTVDQQITLQARESPEAIAVSFENDHLTYAALNRRANQLAHYLQSVGVSRNSLVGVMLERSVDMVVALLGILKAGAAYLPLDPGYPCARLERMLADARPIVLLTQQAPAASLPTHGAQILCLDTERWRLEEQSDAEPESRASFSDLAYVIFTSGSTGGPKGVQIHHAALMNFLNAMKCHFSRHDVLVAVTTLSFDIAGLEIFAPLMVGARTVIVRSEIAADGLSLAAALQQAGATLMQATPTTWRLLLQAGWNPGKHFKAFCGGEALPQALADRLLDRCSGLWNLYGPTETTIWSAAYQVERGSRPIVPIGKPIANTQIYILDAMLQPVPVGVAGELYIGGDGVSVGYLNQPELTATKFIANPFDESGQTRLYKSGDLARFLADGNIEYLGRLDHQVKVNGFRIELAEIEAQLLRHPRVQEAVVEAREDTPGVKRLVAYIVRRTTSSLEFTGQPDLTISELRNFLNKSLPHFMLPASCIFMDAFPLTPNGKLDRRALPAPDENRPALAEKYVAPRNRLEIELSQAWAKTLKLDRVGVKDNFFDLGGASLQSLEVTSRLNDAGIKITPEMIFAHQTVAELALAIENGVTPIQSKEPAKPSDPMPGVLPLTAPPVSAWSPVKRCNLVMESLGVYLPSKSVSTEQVLAGCRSPVLFPLERLTGIKFRRVAGENEFSIDLAKKAVADCLRKSKYRPEQIDVLICCNVSRYDGPNRFSFEPSTALKLRSIFGFSNALVFDINNACAGMFTAIMISDALIKNGSASCAMVVSGEYISHLAASAQREIDGFMDSRLACLTVGDAGAAVILEQSPTPEVGFQEIDMYTLGKYSPLCIAKITDGEHGGAIMYTDSIGQTAVASRNAVMHSADVMQRCGWSAESVDWLIMHQTSETTMRDVARALNDALGKPACHDGNVVYNLAERGNTATTTHFVALRDVIQKGEVKSGERVVFGISGSGQTVGTALYRLDDLPDRLRLLESGGTVPSRPEKSGGTQTRPKQFLPRVEITGIGLLPRDHELERVAITMARQAAENCLQDCSEDRNDIELLIHAGIYRDDFLAEPAMAALLAGELKINEDIVSIADKKSFVFDICNGAVGFLNACYVASQLIQAQRYRTAMIVASEIENNTNALDVQRGVQETASAVMLRASAGGRTGLGHFVFKCKTQHIDALSTYTAKLDARTVLRVEEHDRLQDFFVNSIPEAVEELLALEALDVSQIAIVLGPQVSAEFTTRLSETVRISRDKFVDVALDGKDLFTNSLAYSLQCANSTARSGDIGLIISVGSGIQIGCATYHF